ncbi:HAMP domain-containing protein [bacterium]|nr:HAMP domain-containing protein [bacterium]
MPPLGLRARFLLACALLVLTTVTASLWTLRTLSQLGGVVGTAVRDTDDATAATAALAGALEREDDALLLALAGDADAPRALDAARRAVDERLARLATVLGDSSEQALAARLRSAITAYRAAASRLAEAGRTTDALLRYHREANPLLRAAVGLTAQIRDQRFEQAQQVAKLARDEALRARRVVFAITGIALAISVLVALHLARVVIAPLRQLMREATAIRSGDFEARIPVRSRDELGQVSQAFNEMAADLADFRRSNVGETLRAKAALEATIEALPDAVVLVDADGRVQSLNGSARRLVAGGRSPATIGALGLDGLSDAAVAAAVAAAGAAPLITELGGALRVTVDGSPRRLLPRVIPLPGFAGGRPGALVLLSDVTDLVRLDEMRAELIAVASHELRTPLTTLRMTLLMLQESAAALTPRQRELVGASLGGIDQLSEIVDEFLDLTRIEAGALRLSCEPLDAAALVDACVRRAAPRAREADLDVHLAHEPHLPAIAADRTRLRVVVDNMLSNALEYTPAGGRVDVEVGAVRDAEGQPTNRVRIAIADSGPGVPPEFRRRVFEKFFRVEHHRPESHAGSRGTGVGLYLCHQIVALHGGTIRCEANPRGRGACFVVELPATPVGAAVETPA